MELVHETRPVPCMSWFLGPVMDLDAGSLYPDHVSFFHVCFNLADVKGVDLFEFA